MQITAHLGNLLGNGIAKRDPNTFEYKMII